MKQLTIRLLAPVSTNTSFLARFLQFSLRQINTLAATPQLIIGKWRLYLNYCPECNSCAPKLHHCDVCKADTKSYFSWNEEVEKTLWKRYAEKHRIAA